MRTEIGRMHAGVFGTSVSAAQDFFELIAPSTGRGIRIHRVEVGADSEETSQQLVVLLKVAKGTYATGTGGSTPTAVRLKTGAGTSSATLKANNTSAASAGTGSLTTVGRRTWNVVTGFLYAPTEPEVISLAPGEAFIVNLVNAPGAAITLSGEIIWEELN